MRHPPTTMHLSVPPAEELRSPTDRTQLSRRRGTLPKMPFSDRKTMHVRQEDAQESALLALRRLLWAGLWQKAQMRLTFMSSPLPSTWGLRGCSHTVPAALWEGEEDLRPSLRKAVPRAVCMQGRQSLSVQGHNHMLLSTKERGSQMQCSSRHARSRESSELAQMR
jgi:hypothetical protein